MNRPEEKISSSKINFDDYNQETKSWPCLGQTWSRFVTLILSLLFLSSCRLSLVSSAGFIIGKLVTNHPFGQQFCAIQQDTFSLAKTKIDLISLNSGAYIFLAGPFETRKMHSIYKLLKFGTFQMMKISLTKLLFPSMFPSTQRCSCTEVASFGFVQ